MNQGDPNPKKYYVCCSISTHSEFSSFTEAIEYFKSDRYPYDLMLVEHKGQIDVVKTVIGSPVVVSRFRS